MCEGIEEVKGEVIGIEPIGSGEPLLFARGLVRLLWEESPVLATQAGSMKAKGRPQENLCIPEELFFFYQCWDTGQARTLSLRYTPQLPRTC